MTTRIYGRHLGHHLGSYCQKVLASSRFEFIRSKYICVPNFILLHQLARSFPYQVKLWNFHFFYGGWGRNFINSQYLALSCTMLSWLIWIADTIDYFCQISSICHYIYCTCNHFSLCQQWKWKIFLQTNVDDSEKWVVFFLFVLQKFQYLIFQSCWLVVS